MWIYGLTRMLHWEPMGFPPISHRHRVVRLDSQEMNRSKVSIKILKCDSIPAMSRCFSVCGYC